MPWLDVKTVLLDRVIPLMTDQGKGREWVEVLEHSPDGPRLGACIAIDVVSGSLPPDIFASVLDLINLPITDARWSFADAVERHPDNFVCASSFTPTPLEHDDVYVRVLELGNFITYYAGPAHSYSSLDPDDVREVQRVFFSPDDDEEWPDIDVEWSGSMGRIFVLSHKELTNLIDGITDKGAVVNDSLGLGKDRGVGDDDKPLFVKVIYPDDFSYTCVQPTTLDVPWTYPTWFYLSYGDADTWGRTHSCSGRGKNVRERVHFRLAYLTGSYSGRIIGTASSPLVADRYSLLAEAYNRLAAIL